LINAILIEAKITPAELRLHTYARWGGNKMAFPCLDERPWFEIEKEVDRYTSLDRNTSDSTFYYGSVLSDIMSDHTRDFYLDNGGLERALLRASTAGNSKLLGARLQAIPHQPTIDRIRLLGEIVSSAWDFSVRLIEAEGQLSNGITDPRPFQRLEMDR